MSDEPWFSPRDLKTPGVRLFCLPHAGSGAAGFYRWKRLVPDRIAVCPVLLPGREARLRDSLFTSVEPILETLAEHSCDLVDRPYAIFGHSMGALLAFEWVRRVLAMGARAPLCLFVSGRNAPHIGSTHRRLHGLAEQLLAAELKRHYGGDPEALLHDRDLREVFLPILRADLQVVETYVHLPSRLPLPCAVYAFAGRQDQSVSDDGLAGWGEVTHANFAHRRFPGDHFYHFGEGQTDLLRVIAETPEIRPNGALSLSPEAS